MKYKVIRDGFVIADGLTEPRFEDFDADPNKNHVYDVVAYEVYDVFRDDVLIADDITVPYFEDTGLESDVDYKYTVDIFGVKDSEASVTTRTTEPPGPPPTTTILVSNRRLIWADLPAYNQENNRSLKLLSDNGDGTYTYEADFDWDNDEINTTFPLDLTWLVDVLQFKNNQLKSGGYAFHKMPAAELTALPKLDTSNLTNMASMFKRAPNFNQPLNHFDTSNVTDMDYVFEETKMNHPLDNWDTSEVTKMGYIFYNTPFDQDISNWCVEKVAKVPPPNWATFSGFQDKPEKHPKWGEPCNTVSEAQVVEEPKPEPTPEPKPEPKPAPRRRGKRRRRR